MTGALLSRGTRLPVELEITAIHSPEVPLGILELEYTTEIVVRGRRQKGRRTYSLLAFHDAAGVPSKEPVTVPDDH